MARRDRPSLPVVVLQVLGDRCHRLLGRLGGVAVLDHGSHRPTQKAQRGFDLTIHPVVGVDVILPHVVDDARKHDAADVDRSRYELHVRIG